MTEFGKLSDAAAWHLLVDAARMAIEAKGYKLTRMPGRGRSNVWQIALNGKTQTASIRTTTNRWIAFPPLKEGSQWKTLDDVQVVVVAAVDVRDDPQNVEVYFFSATEVRKRFDAAYAARIKARNVVKDKFGMWVSLDIDKRGIAASVGSGLADEHAPIAVYPMKDLMEIQLSDRKFNSGNTIDQSAVDENQEPTTIAEVMDWARDRLAKIAGVPREAVKLDLKIQH